MASEVLFTWNSAILLPVEMLARPIPEESTDKLEYRYPVVVGIGEERLVAVAFSQYSYIQGPRIVALQPRPSPGRIT
jgi:hypothetical protein